MVVPERPEECSRSIAGNRVKRVYPARHRQTRLPVPQDNHTVL